MPPADRRSPGSRPSPAARRARSGARGVLLAATLLLVSGPAGGKGDAADPSLDFAPLRSLAAAGAGAAGDDLPRRARRAWRRLDRVLARPSDGRLRRDLRVLLRAARAAAGPLSDDPALAGALDDAASQARSILDAAVRGVETWADDLPPGRRRERVERRIEAARQASDEGASLLLQGSPVRAVRRLRAAAARADRACRAAARGLKQAGREPARWRVLLQGLGGTLYGMWGTRDPLPRVFAVGSDDGEGPLFLAWEEGDDAWTRIAALPPGFDLWWVTEVPGDGVYASGSSGSVVRYDPVSGEVSDRATGVEAILFGIWGSGPGDLWAVGGDPLGVGPRPVLLHHDGSGWTSFAAPPGADDRVLFKVWGTASDDVWACGEGGILLHFDGEAWSEVPSGTPGILVTVHGPAPRTAVGGGVSAVVVEEGPTGIWEPAPVPPAVPALIGVWVPGGGEPAYAVGAAGTVLRRDTDGGWTVLRGIPVPGVDYHSVWVDGEGNALLSGGDLSDQTDGVLLSRGTREFPAIVR